MSARTNVAPIANDAAQRNRLAVLTQFHGFVSHDLDAIMGTFGDDCTYEEHRGPHAYGRRFSGKTAIRAAFAAIFARTPHCSFRDPVVVADATHATAQWTFVVSTRDATPFEIEGIDLFELRDGKVVTKKSWLKARRIPLGLILRDVARRIVSAKPSACDSSRVE